MARDSLTIKSDERVALIGRTGSGKSYFAEQVLTGANRLLVVDPNAVLAQRFRPHIPWNAKAARLMSRGDPVRARLVPPTLSARDLKEWYEGIFQAVFEAGDMIVYLDEAYGVVPPGETPPDALWSLYTRGRARGIGVWASTQRPRFIPRFMLSEAEWYVIFQLNLEDDRRYVASFTDPVLRQKAPDKHGFFLYNIAWDRPRYSHGLRRV